MKPFDPNKPYCRRDGKPAKIVHTFRDGRHIVVLEDPQDTETYYSIHPTGHVYRDGNNFHLDLINIPEKIELVSEYTLSCFSCGSKNNLRMFAQRRENQQMVGWIFICDKCETPDGVKVSLTEGRME